MDIQSIENFINQVRIRAYDDAYIDTNEEKEILVSGVSAGLGMDEAQALLGQACARFGFGRESQITEVLEICLDQFCANDGKIDIGEFKDTVDIAMALLKKAAPRASLSSNDFEDLAYRILQKKRYAIQNALKRHLKRLGL